MTAEQGAEPAIRVLIIDDDEPLRQALKRTLIRLGYAVLEASDGATGLAAVAIAAPDIIFLDLRMPGMDGLAFMRHLKGQGEPWPPVIVMSGHGNMDDVIDVLRSGAVDYIRKPWTLAEVLSAATRAFEEKARRNQGRAETLAPVPPAPSFDSKRNDRLIDLLARLRRGEVVLPAIPAVLLTLRRQIEDPCSVLDDIARTVESDPRLSADLLRLANSAHFSQMGRATGVRDAISRLGLTHVHNLLRTIFLQDLCDVPEGPYRKLLTTVWRRSVARALAMRALCELLGPRQGLNGDTAYVIGLMADIGASLLFWIVSQQDRGNLTLEDVRDTAAVLTLVRTTHEDLGRAMVERWNLEKVVAAAVANHHREVPPSTNASWWALGLIGDYLATAIVGEADPTTGKPQEAAVVVRYATELTLPLEILRRLPDDLALEFAAIEAVLVARSPR